MPPPQQVMDDSPPLMATPPESVPDVGIMATPPPTDTLREAPPAAAFTVVGGGADDDNERLPELMPLELEIDEPKLKLPSFDDFSRTGGSKPLPPPPGAAGALGALRGLVEGGGGGGDAAAQGAAGSDGYESKLPSINPGTNKYAVEKEEQPFFERVVFGLSIGGIAFLIFVEIFINTPLFQQIRPAILQFLNDGEPVE